MKENVIPTQARAVVNIRILPGDTLEAAQRHIRAVINDERIHIRLLDAIQSEPSPVSDTNTPAYRRLSETIRQVWPEALVAPGLVLGATDCRSYAHLSECSFRFSPLVVEKDDLERVHGANERLTVENYAQMIRFYEILIETV
jgi:carboxypeptidase PM20D1